MKAADRHYSEFYEFYSVSPENFGYRLVLGITDGLNICSSAVAMNVGPCHHGMARPRVADGGTASNMEGSCE